MERKGTTFVEKGDEQKLMTGLNSIAKESGEKKLGGATQ